MLKGVDRGEAAVLAFLEELSDQVDALGVHLLELREVEVDLVIAHRAGDALDVRPVEREVAQQHGVEDHS